MRKQNSHARWSLPAMEHLITNNDYAFSYNPEAQPASWAIDKLPKWWADMAKIFGALKASDVNIAVEISKLGRLHFHGTIKVTSKWKFYYYDVPNLMKDGSFEIDTIKERKDWDTYVDKNKDEMSDMMEAFGLPRTLATKNIKIPKVNHKEVKRFFTQVDESESESSASEGELLKSRESDSE